MGTKNLNSATNLITFTRASGGTALRKISYGNELLTNGTFDTDSDWSKGAGWTISGGVASFSYSTGNEFFQTMSLSAGVYKIEVETTGVGGRVYFNSPSISTTSILASGSNTIYIAHNGSYTKLSFLGIGNSSFSIDNISLKEVLFDQADGTLQLWNHSNNVPRIEYDATGAVKGLLIEEARTNTISTSEVAPTAYSGGITKSVDSSVVSPAGGNNVEKFTLSSVNSQHYFGNHNNISASSGYSTYSIFAKASGHNLIRLRMKNTAGLFYCDYNLATGQKQVNSSAHSSVTGAIESMGNGWWRCSMTYASEKTNPYATVFLINAMDASLSNSFLGDGTSGVYVWGSQYEAGAFPTSYIPTSGSTATRAADFAQIPTSAFGYNNDKGSLVIDVLMPDVDQFMILTYFNTTSYHNSRGFVKSNSPSNGIGNFYSYRIFDGASTLLPLGAQTQAERTKLGLSYGDSERAVRDGGTAISGTSRSPNPTRLFLGGRDTGLQSQCWIKSIKYYPRQLTDTQLQELTT